MSYWGTDIHIPHEIDGTTRSGPSPLVSSIKEALTCAVIGVVVSTVCVVFGLCLSYWFPNHDHGVGFTVLRCCKPTRTFGAGRKTLYY